MLTDFKLDFKIDRQSISDTRKYIDVVTSSSFKVNNVFLKSKFDQLYNLTYKRTMTATGETRSKLYKKNYMLTSISKFEVGYKPTTNNQSYFQEFKDGKVHTFASHHYSKTKKLPICSVKPNNIFEARGSHYFGNRAARRKALRVSIEEVFGSRNVIVAYLSGNIRYEPDLSQVVMRMIGQTRKMIKIAKSV